MKAVLAALLLLAAPVAAQEFVAAGVPRALAQGRDYRAIFTHLKDKGFSVFFPTFQYVESPQAAGFGFESDFLPPCSADDPAFVALRETGIGLIVPAPLLYPDPAHLPPLERDPLRALITCAGTGLRGVSSFDEPVSNGISLEQVRAVYARVKRIDPALDVLMVHAPLPDNRHDAIAQPLRQAYFESVRQFSMAADIVGFDIYPYPEGLTGLASPFQPDGPVAADTLVADYARWLAQALPDKRHLMVLQGFAYADMFKELGPDWAVAPSALQIDRMVAGSGDATLIIWWGQAALGDIDQMPWAAISRP